MITQGTPKIICINIIRRFWLYSAMLYWFCSWGLHYVCLLEAQNVIFTTAITEINLSLTLQTHVMTWCAEPASHSALNSIRTLFRRGGQATLRIVSRNEGTLMLSVCAGALLHLSASIYADERHEELRRRTTLIRYHQERSDMSADKMTRLMVRVLQE